MAKIFPVIMCGGSGTRVWPESRESLPKQFIPLIGDRSTFQSIVRGGRATIRCSIGRSSSPISTTASGSPSSSRRSARRRPSCSSRSGATARPRSAPPRRGRRLRDPKTIVAILAADHVFQNEKEFARLCGEAAHAAAAGEIVTFGVKPDHPATGYGYIQPGRPASRRSEDSARRAVRGKAERGARARPSSKRGICGTPEISSSAPTSCWRSSSISSRRSPRRQPTRSPSPRRISDSSFSTGTAFVQAPRTSIDYAVMERTRARGGAGGRRRLVGRRPVVDRLAAEPAATPTATACAGGPWRSTRRTCSSARTSISRR